VTLSAYQPRITLCPTCGKEFTAKWNVSTLKFTVYCSRQCSNKANRKILSSRSASGKDLNNKARRGKTMRKKIKEIDGMGCHQKN
jgi:hypothetical protein